MAVLTLIVLGLVLSRESAARPSIRGDPAGRGPRRAAVLACGALGRRNEHDLIADRAVLLARDRCLGVLALHRGGTAAGGIAAHPSAAAQGDRAGQRNVSVGVRALGADARHGARGHRGPLGNGRGCGVHGRGRPRCGLVGFPHRIEGAAPADGGVLFSTAAVLRRRSFASPASRLVRGSRTCASPHDGRRHPRALPFPHVVGGSTTCHHLAKPAKDRGVREYGTGVNGALRRVQRATVTVLDDIHHRRRPHGNSPLVRLGVSQRRVHDSIWPAEKRLVATPSRQRPPGVR